MTERETYDYDVYTDASFDRESRLAVGGMLLQPSTKFEEINESNLASFAVQTRLIAGTNISQAELKTVIWAMETIKAMTPTSQLKIRIFTDCRNICELQNRRLRLQASDFVSKRSGRPLANSALYREFFALCDDLQPGIIWLKGHTKASEKRYHNQIFSQVDRECRRVLRLKLDQHDIKSIHIDRIEDA